MRSVPKFVRRSSHDGGVDLEELIRHAEGLGFRVELRAPSPGNAGELRAGGRIIVDPTLSLMAQRVTIAHELGHAHHGHDWSQRHDKRRDERQANEFAANLLIHAPEVEAAAILYDGDPRAIARELGLPVALLRLWAQSRAPINEL